MISDMLLLLFGPAPTTPMVLIDLLVWAVVIFVLACGGVAIYYTVRK